MKVTSKVYLTKKETGNLKAFASITIEDKIVITGLKVVEGKNGLFINFPQYKDSNGDYKDIAYPLSKDIRNNLTKLVLSEYNKLVKENSDNNI